MEIKLSNEESEKYFHNALCNGLGYIQGYGIELTHKEDDYNKARKSIQKKMDDCKIEKNIICYEDVLVEILRIGGLLYMEDNESNDMNSTISLADVHNRVATTPIEHLTDMISGNDDATTADIIIQTVFYKEIIFG